jgi:hypothetical protein
LGESLFYDEDIVLSILSEQNDWFVGHGWGLVLKVEPSEIFLGVEFAGGLKPLRAQQGWFVELKPETFDITGKLVSGLG